MLHRIWKFLPVFVVEWLAQYCELVDGWHTVFENVLIRERKPKSKRVGINKMYRDGKLP